VPQAKAYQARLSPQEYERTLRDLFSSIREANPDALIFLDISPSPKGAVKTSEEMLASVRSLQDVINGVWITHNPDEISLVQSFASQLGR
jgi:hypothetical protein